ncbi:MAG TPA: carbamoyl phosphate synthase small subunit [Gemmatimonadetes bacterium]|nr:carbamoyl phosphate synthase small subunit [Gemmatimonadota bacterium]
MKPGAVILADGAIFRGNGVGAEGVATGELVFNTAMTGYQEIATDPSYAGQIVVMTASHIGNYGATKIDEQADQPWCTGFVMRSSSRRHSSWRADSGFEEWLVQKGIVAIDEVDTRRLTRHIRTYGAMPGAIGVGVTDEELLDMAMSAPSMDGQNLVERVSTSQSYTVPAHGQTVARVVAYDLGIKRDILSSFARRGVEVIVVPSGTTADNVLAMEPNGVFLSNGPGDPEPLIETVEAIRGILGVLPVFGICLGHQILGLALGATTFKLPFGHHGGNHPVKRLEDGRVEITSQNHGFAVDLWSLTGERRGTSKSISAVNQLPGIIESAFGALRASHQNLNDGTLEGIECLDIPAFSVQYHPEAAPGPHDAESLFDRFMEMMRTGVVHAAP